MDIISREVHYMPRQIGLIRPESSFPTGSSTGGARLSVFRLPAKEASCVHRPAMINPNPGVRNFLSRTEENPAWASPAITSSGL